MHEGDEPNAVVGLPDADPLLDRLPGVPGLIWLSVAASTQGADRRLAEPRKALCVML